MNLGAGASVTVPFTFTDPQLDLALISLDQRDSRFADELTSLGFVPVTSNDITDGPDAEGQEVFTIGFPKAQPPLGQKSASSDRPLVFKSLFITSILFRARFNAP